MEYAQRQIPDEVIHGCWQFFIVTLLVAGWLVLGAHLEAHAQSNPILVVTDDVDPFGQYYAEILRTEGFNAFTISGISSVSATTLAAYDMVILDVTSLTSPQVTMSGSSARASSSRGSSSM